MMQIVTQIIALSSKSKLEITSTIEYAIPNKYSIILTITSDDPSVCAVQYKNTIDEDTEPTEKNMAASSSPILEP